MRPEIALRASKFSARAEALSNPLLRYYLREMGKDAKMAALAKRLSQEPLARGPNQGRISLTLEKQLWGRAWERAKQAGIRDKSDVVRGIIIAAAIDAGIDKPSSGEKPSPRRRIALEAIATSVA